MSHRDSPEKCQPTDSSVAPADAIALEIYRQLFTSIAEEMGVRLMRSAYSPNIKERRDYSCALFDAAGSMIAQAAHIPVHLGSTPASVAAILKQFPPEWMKPGEQFIVNDPFAGGTHLPDITLVVPVFLTGNDRPRFFVANRAHHADVGGIAPGSMPLSRSIDEEGVRIPPSRVTDELLRDIAHRTRTPDERFGDLQAQQAAAATGVQRLGELCEQHGPAVVRQRAADLQDYAARLVHALLAEMPDGEYRFTDYLDDDGFGRRDIAIRCVLTIDGDRATVDLRESNDQVAGPMNAVRAIAVSAVNYVFRCLGPTDMPANAGLMRPITVRTRPGSVVDAQPPAAVAGGNVETSQRIVDVLLGALAQPLPGRIPAASCGSMNNLTIGGTDPRHDDAPFAYYETIAGGAGAGPGGDGQSAVHTHMTNTLNTPIEALEHACPLRIERYAIRTGSGGAGQHRGGDGVVRVYHFLAPATLTLLTERRTRRPWGLQGGEPGATGENHLQSPADDGDANPAPPDEALPAKCTRDVPATARLTIQTPAAGGWGKRHAPQSG